MLRQDDHHAARAFFESALSHAPTSSPLLVGAIFSALALLEARDGRVEEARRLLAESTPLLATGGKQPEVVRCTARRAETAFWLGDIAAARAFLAEAEALCGSGPIFDDEILYALSAAQSCLSGTAEHSGQAI